MYCVPCEPKKYKCEHGKRKEYCKECGGSAFCKHGKQKQICKKCGGSGICEHGKRKSRCKECGGSEFCEHGKNKYVCKECDGSGICEHGKNKSICKECGGSGICKHGKQKRFCKECDGSAFCEHGKEKSRCKECGGSQICKGNKEPYNTGCYHLGNRKYNGFCTHCFANLFPNDPKTAQIRIKSKELKVVSYISSKYEGFYHDKCMYVDLEGGCCATKRRIDLRKLIGNTMLCIEIDEEQHKHYIKQDENDRYDDLFMDFSGKYIFIRYNPDKFKDKHNKSKNPLFDTRMEELKKKIDKHIERINNNENTELVEIHHLFYNDI